MGCYSSKNADSPANRVARWRSTGIVALRDRKLKAVPAEIFEVDGFVRTLDLTNNSIVEIPSEISKLISMQRLVLADNQIERLPANLGVFKSLKILKLDGNRIKMIPNELGSLSRLEKFSASGNLLTSLPKTIGDLHSLPHNLLKDCKALQHSRFMRTPFQWINSSKWKDFKVLKLEERRNLISKLI